MRKTWIRIGTTLITIGVMVMIFCFSTEPAEKSDTTSGIISKRVADAVRPGWDTLRQEEKKLFFDTVQYYVRKTPADLSGKLGGTEKRAESVFLGGSDGVRRSG